MELRGTVYRQSLDWKTNRKDGKAGKGSILVRFETNDPSVFTAFAEGAAVVVKAAEDDE